MACRDVSAVTRPMGRMFGESGLSCYTPIRASRFGRRTAHPVKNGRASLPARGVEVLLQKIFLPPSTVGMNLQLPQYLVWPVNFCNRARLRAVKLHYCVGSIRMVVSGNRAYRDAVNLLGDFRSLSGGGLSQVNAQDDPPQCSFSFRLVTNVNETHPGMVEKPFREFVPRHLRDGP